MDERKDWSTVVKYAWVSVYAPVNVRTVKGKNEMRFWNEVNECIKSL